MAIPVSLVGVRARRVVVPARFRWNLRRRFHRAPGEGRDPFNQELAQTGTGRNVRSDYQFAELLWLIERKGDHRNEGTQSEKDDPEPESLSSPNWSDHDFARVLENRTLPTTSGGPSGSRQVKTTTG
jgi:hypothetical protein